MTGGGHTDSTGARDPGAEELLSEGRRFGRYLLRRKPSEVAIERYVAACPHVFKAQVAPADRALLRFAAGHGWSLPLLDAVCGLLAPQALLRKKIFLMLAILETLPAHVPVFTPRPSSIPAVLFRLGWLGIVSALLVLCGLPIYFWARRAR